MRNPKYYYFEDENPNWETHEWGFSKHSQLTTHDFSDSMPDSPTKFTELCGWSENVRDQEAAKGGGRHHLYVMT